jgi:hypothetical protein
VAVTAPPPLAGESPQSGSKRVYEPHSGPHTKPPPPEWNELVADEDKKKSTTL